jgi:hypothetical protein
MAWLRADDVFAAADAEDDALNPAPWLERREGPMRKPDEDRIKEGSGDSASKTACAITLRRSPGRSRQWRRRDQLICVG